MSIVIYTNPKNGCKYAYESTYVWSPEHQQSRPKRKYLGRVDEDGNIIYSSHKRGGFREKSPKTKEKEAQAESESGKTSNEEAEKYKKMYEHAENDRQECMRKIHELEIRISDLERKQQSLRDIFASIHSMTDATQIPQ